MTKNYTTILSGDSSGNLFYWDFNFQKKKSYKFHSEAITDISLSFNDLKFITSSDDKKAKIIDVERGEEENEFEHGSNLKSCHWNPYKSIVATAGKDNLIKIWKFNIFPGVSYDGQINESNSYRLFGKIIILVRL